MVFPRPEILFDRLAPCLPLLPVWALGGVSGTALLGGTAAIAFHHPWIGAGLLLAGFAADGLGQATARRGRRTAMPLLPFGVMLALFGFALADPARTLAAMFLMFSLSVFTLLSGPRVRLIHWLAAAGLLVACFLTDRFSLLVYIIGIVCFVKEGQGLAVRL
jgi:hypothetical protein